MRWSCIRAFGSLKFEIAHLSRPSGGRKHQDVRHAACGHVDIIHFVSVIYLSGWIPACCQDGRCSAGLTVHVCHHQHPRGYNNETWFAVFKSQTCTFYTCSLVSLNRIVVQKNISSVLHFVFLLHALQGDLEPPLDSPLPHVYFGPPTSTYTNSLMSVISCPKYNTMHDSCA